MSNHHQNYIFSVCQQLHDAGKTPTVGLIRAKADRKLTIPAIISALKHWQHNPQQGMDTQPEADESLELTLEDRIMALEQEVASLKQTLFQLQIGKAR